MLHSSASSGPLPINTHMHVRHSRIAMQELLNLPVQGRAQWGGGAEGQALQCL